MRSALVSAIAWTEKSGLVLEHKARQHRQEASVSGQVQAGSTHKGSYVMKQMIEKSDMDLKRDVLSELKYEPSVKVSDIGVTVKDGAVTLNGTTMSYVEKWNALKAAKRVAGVVAIADEMNVRLPDSLQRTDGEIAATAAQQIEWSQSDLAKTLKVTVCEGWITLEGEVAWWYQKNAAEETVHYLAGVKGVSNLITLKVSPPAADMISTIHAAFERSAILNADKIQIETNGNKVTLRGNVQTYLEEEEAGRIAWGAPGVRSVDNELVVNWSCFVS